MHSKIYKAFHTLKHHSLYATIALLTLPLIVLTSGKIQSILSHAAPLPANIIIDVKNTEGVINPSWLAFSQGGEETEGMLKNVVDKLRPLSPRFIRIDHIYDFYQVVRKKSDSTSYDFTKLDYIVDDILKMGAIPVFSLSYMPNVFTANGSIIDMPTDWNDWKNLVRETIAHYSGKDRRNLSNVYYEVWNEPELPQFGNFTISGGKDYRLLYFHAVKGAQEATNTNQFRIGGPAIGSYYPAWINGFLSYVAENNLRLDFFSWHRYSKNPDQFAIDAKNTRNLLANFPTFATIPLLLTEWGIDSGNTPINNSNSNAAFTIVSAAKFSSYIAQAFSFEVKDGPPPSGGTWGLFSHEKSDPPLSPKPRFAAFETLSHLKGSRIHVSGEGAFVSGLAAKDGNSIAVALGNYDINNQNTENVPVTFTGLDPGSYILHYAYPLDKSSGNFDLVTTNGTLTKSFILPSNSILSLELSFQGKLASFIPGAGNEISNQALVLGNSDTPLVFSFPEFSLTSEGSIRFTFKPLWQKTNAETFRIFEAPYPGSNGDINRLYLLKEFREGKNSLIFGLRENQEEIRLAYPIDTWIPGSWHTLFLSWNQNNLSFQLDTEPPKTIDAPLSIDNGHILTFYPVTAAIDSLQITSSGKSIITREFNGETNR